MNLLDTGSLEVGYQATLPARHRYAIAGFDAALAQQARDATDSAPISAHGSWVSLQDVRLATDVTTVPVKTARARDARWEALFDALLLEYSEISCLVRQRLHAELPAYRSMSSEEMDADLRFEIERTLLSARAGQAAVTDRELAELAEIGDKRAQQGVPIEDMLRAWRIGVQVVVARAREIGARLEVDDASLLDFVESTLAWSEVATVKMAAAHRSAEFELAREAHERRAAFVRNLLVGDAAPADIRVQSGAYGVDPSREYAAIRARAGASSSLHAIERALGFQSAIEPRRGLGALIDDDLAGFVSEPPTTIVSGVVGIGPPRPLERLTESFRLATRALATADGFGLTGVHSVASLGPRVAIAADRDVGQDLAGRYLDPVSVTPSAQEILTSLRVYFECGMHVRRASERLLVHQNTLRYRIARFEELSGVNLRDPVIAFEVWWALEHQLVAERRPHDAEVTGPARAPRQRRPAGRAEAGPDR